MTGQLCSDRTLYRCFHTCLYTCIHCLRAHLQREREEDNPTWRALALSLKLKLKFAPYGVFLSKYRELRYVVYIWCVCFTVSFYNLYLTFSYCKLIYTKHITILQFTDTGLFNLFHICRSIVTKENNVL